MCSSRPLKHRFRLQIILRYIYVIQWFHRPLKHKFRLQISILSPYRSMFGELMTENRLNSVTFILNTARKILLKDDKVSSSEIAFSVVFSSKITNKTLYMLAYSKTQLGQKWSFCLQSKYQCSHGNIYKPINRLLEIPKWVFLITMFCF